MVYLVLICSLAPSGLYNRCEEALQETGPDDGRGDKTKNNPEKESVEQPEKAVKSIVKTSIRDR